MNISAPFIHRPVATILLGLAVLVAGIMGFFKLSVSSMPQVDFPSIEVTTQLPGANPDAIGALVTASLEKQFGQIPSLAAMTSQSSFGLSRITLQFDLDRDIDAAAQDVQSAINAAGATLPRDLPYPPTYTKVNPADAPVLTLMLRSRIRSIRDLSDFADTQIAPRLSEISGVGRVVVEGGVKPAIRIQADIARIAANHMTMDDLRIAIVNANTAGAKGSIDGSRQSITLDTDDQLFSAKQFNTIVVNWMNGRPVMLRDVAKVVEGLENSRVGAWHNGEQAVIMDVIRQPGANIINVVEAAKRTLPQLRRQLPENVSLDIINDRTDTIRASIRDVEWTLLITTVLVVLVILLFLRSVAATIIALISLPLSIIATFAAMWAAGFSLNNLSLMALTIGTGFVVDDAIVMIENIVRNIETGKSPFRAALDGAREIGFTIVALTASLIAVFVPLLFMSGIVGRMFREFALTLSIAVIISAIVSLTLTPMLCSLLLRRQYMNASERNYAHHDQSSWLDKFYAATLRFVLRRQSETLLVTAMTFAVTIALYALAPKGFLPHQDTGLLTATLEASADISFEGMTSLQARIGEILRSDKDVSGVSSVLGIGPLNSAANIGHFAITLRNHNARSESAEAIASRLQTKAQKYVGAALFIEPVQDIQISTRNSRSQYQYTLSSSDSTKLAVWTQKMLKALRAQPAFRNVSAETLATGMRSVVRINRGSMGRLGISAQNVDDVINDAFGQRQISMIYTQANQYRVILEAAPQYQHDPAALEKLYVAAPGGGPQTPLQAFTHIETEPAALSILHQEQFPAQMLSFDLAPEVSLGEALDAIKETQKAIKLPSDITGVFSGDAAEFDKSLSNQPLLLLAALISIYIVLGVLYESFIHPFTVITTLPSAGIGALLTLKLVGLDLSVVALIGVVLLMGIVKKNAIMMIDFAIDMQRTRGITATDAIISACHMRFRPIMMTTLAALLGATPLALSSGPGSELRVPLGVSVIGGLLISQLLTLYTTPVVYLAGERLRNAFRRRAVVQTARRNGRAFFVTSPEGNDE